MAEYVDKEIVKEAIGMIANACLANPRITRGEIQTFFKGIPIADVRPVVRSHWKKNDNGTYSCERCHSWIPEEQRHYANWCLYCGADMRDGDDK